LGSKKNIQFNKILVLWWGTFATIFTGFFFLVLIGEPFGRSVGGLIIAGILAGIHWTGLFFTRGKMKDKKFVNA
jgi:hypothetical protein